jgi:hypothetical protein
LFKGDGLLDTAYDDFRSFLGAGNISDSGKYKIITAQVNTSCFEEYNIDVARNVALYQPEIRKGFAGAGACRRHLVSSGGPFLKKGV